MGKRSQCRTCINTGPLIFSPAIEASNSSSSPAELREESGGEGNNVGAGRELKSLEDSRDTKSENISDFMFRGSAGGWRTWVFLSVECMTVVIELLAPPQDSYLEG